jgi:hypothetical protein
MIQSSPNTGYHKIFPHIKVNVLMTVDCRFKLWTVFARSNAAIVGSNPTRSTDVCVCVCVTLCLGSGLATGWSPVQGVLPTVWKRLRKWRRGQGPTKGCRAIDEWMNEFINLKKMFRFKPACQFAERYHSAVRWALNTKYPVSANFCKLNE